MDEPTASLPEHEVENLFRVVRELKSQGVGIVYISHRLDELYALADRRDRAARRPDHGHAADEGRRAAELIRLMVGHESPRSFRSAT